MTDSKIKRISFESAKNLFTYTVSLKKRAAWFAPVFSMMVLVGVIAPSLLSDDATLDVPYKIGILIVAAAVPIAFIWYTLKNGLFVLAANVEGVFYRIYETPYQVVFIPWGMIKEISEMYEEGGKEVVLDLTRGVGEMPQPNNGESRLLNDIWRVSFMPGMGNKARTIVAELSALRNVASLELGEGLRKAKLT